MLEIGMLRAMWRALETGLRLTLLGHEGGNSGHRQGFFLVSYRASARPYQAIVLSIVSLPYFPWIANEVHWGFSFRSSKRHKLTNAVVMTR